MRMLILRLLSRRGFAVRASALVVLGALAACNLSVDNPDRVWDSAQQARWVAEDAVRRFRDVMGAQFDSYDLGAKALLYAGYANRLLGENMCEAVIDGGAPSDYKDYFRRAESALTEAIS